MKSKCCESFSQWPSSFSRSHTDVADPPLPSGAAVGPSVDVEVVVLDVVAGTLTEDVGTVVEDELEDVVGTSEVEDVVGIVVDENVVGIVVDEDVIGIVVDEDVLRIAVVEDSDVVASGGVLLATGSSHTSS
jgi:hypothetical protein